ncbi:hypothetical protein [Algiphilus aromaticivorans]|uniref:hypothetical protein n=1 Tax=Algiphilus aromaticivorans TaxID=382454 RepID=UPI0012ECA928|nr:hypothetical protein [Algiphilus aromaticivorans]
MPATAKKTSRTPRKKSRVSAPALASPQEGDSVTSLAGRDANLPEWMLSQAYAEERPKYDSAVVIGSGISGLCCAARLARSKSFNGKVVLLGQPPAQSRRLIGGLTLRARALDYFAACLGISRSVLLDRLYDGRAAEVACHRQVAARFTRHRNGEYEIGPRGEWMSRWEHQGRILAYGVRNSHMAGTIYEFMVQQGIEWKNARPQSLSDCLDLAPGKKPFVINCNPAPLPGLGGIPVKPKRFVVAAQVPFSAPHREAKGILQTNTSFFCGRRRGGSLDASVWYPLLDPLSPSARMYAVFYRIVRNTPKLHKAAETEVLKDHLVGVGHALGLEPVDPEETMGTAVVPCSDWEANREHTPGYIDLGRLANLGTPIIAGDGMPRAALAAYVTAEALIAGVEPQAYLNHAGGKWRFGNRVTSLAFGPHSWAGDMALRWFPGYGLRLIQDRGETWAGVE